MRNITTRMSTTPTIASTLRAGRRLTCILQVKRRPYMLGPSAGVGPDLDLDLATAWERGALHGGTGRLVVAECFRVHRVHLGEVADVSNEHERLGDVAQRKPAVAEDRGDVRERLTGL